jgi:hypothetical protein
MLPMTSNRTGCRGGILTSLTRPCNFERIVLSFPFTIHLETHHA